MTDLLGQTGGKQGVSGRQDAFTEGRLDPEQLAGAMPRALIAEGRAESLAVDWVQRAEQARADGFPALARYPLDSGLGVALFEARRSRRLVRGLEGAEAALESQERGLALAAAARPDSGQRRISRLLIVSADGSSRFYDQVGRLLERYRARLEVVLLECDESQLGGAAFGPGRRARALLLEHKQAVTDFLVRLPVGLPEGGGLSAERHED